MIKHVKKVWGSEDWLVLNEKYCAKFLNINQGYECSVHYHAYKDETFYVLGGALELYVIDLRKIIPVAFPILHPDEPGDYHREYLKRKEDILAGLTKVIVRHGEQYRLKPFTAHKFRSHTFAAKILEVSTTHKDEDSYRITQSQKLD
jgi:D-lyxose ketol-isomerase